MRPRFLVTASTALIVTGLSLSSPAPVRAASNLLFILDSSGSMWGELEGKAKMETAKAALSKLVGDLPEDTKMGLMAYGHRYGRNDPGACADIELLIPVGKASPDDVVNLLEHINPKGKTPIAGSLKQTPAAFAGLEDSNNNIVLISDGIETCDGDPCAIAGELAASNINMRVHVVGFDISEKDRAQLECIAKLGKGKYFPANSTEDFTKAVTEAAKVAQVETKTELAPPPQPPKPVVYFEDNFDGDELADHWEILNPNPDGFIVEDGNLLTIAETPGSLPNDNVENLFLLDKAFPQGDWRLTMHVNVVPQAKAETIALGIYQDKDNYILATPRFRNGSWSALMIEMQTESRSRGKQVSFSKSIWTGNKTHVDGVGTDWAKEIAHLPQPLLVRLEKRGRQYVSMIKFENVENPDWIEMEKLTALRAKGRPVVGYYQHDESYAGNGQGSIEIDWIKIETLE